MCNYALLTIICLLIPNHLRFNSGATLSLRKEILFSVFFPLSLPPQLEHVRGPVCAPTAARASCII